MSDPTEFILILAVLIYVASFILAVSATVRCNRLSNRLNKLQRKLDELLADEAARQERAAAQQSVKHPVSRPAEQPLHDFRLGTPAPLSPAPRPTEQPQHNPRPYARPEDAEAIRRQAAAAYREKEQQKRAENWQKLRLRLVSVGLWPDTRSGSLEANLATFCKPLRQSSRCCRSSLCRSIC